MDDILQVNKKQYAGMKEPLYHGLAKENAARVKYTKLVQKKHTNVKITESGLLVLPDAP